MECSRGDCIFLSLDIRAAVKEDLRQTAILHTQRTLRLLTFTTPTLSLDAAIWSAVAPLELFVSISAPRSRRTFGRPLFSTNSKHCVDEPLRLRRFRKMLLDGVQYCRIYL